MNLRWALKRARRMGLRELGYRGTQQLQTQLQRLGFGRAGAAPASAARGRPWIATWPSMVANGTYRDAAEQIISGNFRLFGREWALGFPPQWNRDPSSGTRAPLVFGKTLDYRDATVVGNIKYLWEPNRHLEMVTLAQAWRLSGERRYAEGCRRLLESWLAQCPYMMGPNWTSSLELALRLINWSCAWHLLGGDGSVLFDGDEGQAFKSRWLAAVRQHCHFIAGHLSRYSSANNHLLGELLGLMVGATTWPCWPESARWRTRALREFEDQALLQNTVDGINREHAIWYQHEVADMMLLGGLTARANECDFTPAFWERLEALLGFICSCMDAGGHVPAFGDADDALIVRFSPAPDFRPYHSLLASGSVLFARADFGAKAGGFDDKSRWLLGDRGEASFAALALGAVGPREGSLRRSFELGGYYVLGSDFDTAREVRLVVDAAQLGYLAIAAHGHADALSMVLSVAGSPMLVDPGTYAYHTEPRWRAYFRGTSAHNTLRVDGEDQSVAGGPFMWMQQANTRCLSVELDCAVERVVAEHDGYCRLSDPLIHRREIAYERAARLVRVTDRLSCSSTHRVEIFWHFAAECQVTLGEAAATITREGLTLVLQWPAPLRPHLARGACDPPLGWISVRFDHKAPTSTLRLAGTVPPAWQGTSTIQIVLPEAGGTTPPPLAPRAG